MALEDLALEIIANLVTAVKERVDQETLILTVIPPRTLAMEEINTPINLEITMVVLHQMIGGVVNCVESITFKVS